MNESFSVLNANTRVAIATEGTMRQDWMQLSKPMVLWYSGYSPVVRRYCWPVKLGRS